MRINGFVDYAFGIDPKLSNRLNETRSASYLSLGGELKFDINIMRFLPEFDIGVRYSYGIKPSDSVFEVLVGTFNF